MRRGFALVEVSVTVGFLALAILIAVFSLLSTTGLSELSKEKVVALADAHRVMEAMRYSADTSVSNLQNTNWTAWALDNVLNTKGQNEPRLLQETVTVLLGTGNPVPVTLTLSWNHRGRPYTVRLVTLMTDRT